MTIIVDVHEPEDIVLRLTELGVDVSREYLEVGDYVIGEHIGIERKTVNDALKSIYDGRYYDQVYNLKENFDRPMVYIIGRAYIPRDIRVVRVLRTVTYLSYGVPVFQVDSDRDFIWDMIELHKKSNKKKPSRRPVKVKSSRSRSIEEIRSDIFTCIYGIGRSTADILSQTYTIKELVNMSEEELRKIKVGKRNVGKYLSVLHKL
mgnify:CR=1 FL=1